MSSSTRLYVGRLNQRTRKIDLEDLFSPFGKIVSCDLKNGLGFGFVEFEDYRDAEDAVRDLDGTELDGSRINVQFSRSSKRGSNSSSGRYGPPQRSDHRCVVDYIPRDMSWQDLKDHFRKCSEVIYADVWQDRGRTKGAVEFRTREDMRKAIKELDGSEIRGSKIDVIEDEDRHSSRSYSRRSSPRYSRRSYSRSRSRDRRRSSRKNKSRSRSRSRSPSKSRSRSRSDSRNRRGKAWSRSPKRSPSPRKKSPSRFERSPSKSRSPSRSKSRSRSRSRSPPRDHSRGRSASRSPGPHKRSRSPSPDRADKRVKLEENEEKN